MPLSSDPPSVAIAYVLQKTTYVFPVIGGRRPEQLYANIEALEITLTKEHIQQIENIVPFDHGFPHNMVFVSYFCISLPLFLIAPS